MTALTPGCDPDMSTTGAPFGATSGGAAGVRSLLVLLAVVAVSASVATGDGPGWLAVAAAVVGLLCALVVLRRGALLAHRAGVATAATAARVVHRSRPVPTAAP